MYKLAPLHVIWLILTYVYLEAPIRAIEFNFRLKADLAQWKKYSNTHKLAPLLIGSILPNVYLEAQLELMTLNLDWRLILPLKLIQMKTKSSTPILIIGLILTNACFLTLP